MRSVAGLSGDCIAASKTMGSRRGDVIFIILWLRDMEQCIDAEWPPESRNSHLSLESGSGKSQNSYPWDPRVLRHRRNGLPELELESLNRQGSLECSGLGPEHLRPRAWDTDILQEPDHR